MRFSLILATLRRTAELTRLLDSLCEQTHKDFALIVVDGGPDSGIEEILQAYADRLDSRYADSALGHSRALNLGLLQAKGDVVAFPDDDCWYDPTLLERVAKQLAAHPEWASGAPREYPSRWAGRLRSAENKYSIAAEPQRHQCCDVSVPPST